MAKLEQLSKTKWKQYFTDRHKELALWTMPAQVARYCKIKKGTNRYIRIELEDKYGLIKEGWFRITSGKEIRFPREFQYKIQQIVFSDKNSYFIGEVLDLDSNKELFISPDQIFFEGKTSFRTHLYRERNSGVVQLKKELVFKNTEKLVCEICSFDFYEEYGVLGSKFIEGHHILPFSQKSEISEIKIEDFLLLCSNCHRMVHRHLATSPEKNQLNDLREALLVKKNLA